MRRRRPLLRACLIGLLLAAAAAPAHAQQDPPPRWAGDGDAETFLGRAQQWLDRHQHTPAAAGVLLDMTMLYEAADHPSAERYKGYLVILYARSIEARFLVRTMNDAGKFRDIVTKAPSQIQHAAARNPRMLYPAIAMGRQVLGPALLDDAAFALLAAFVADHADQPESRDDALQAFAATDAADGPLGQVADLLFDRDLDALDKLARIHEVAGEEDAAAFFRRHYAAALADREDRSPQANELVARHALQEKEWADALDYLRQIDGQARADHADPARLAFWEAFALYGHGRTAEAADAFEQLAEQYAQTGWADRAAELAPHAAATREAVTALADGIDAFRQAVAEGLRQVEFELHLGVPGSDIRAYIGMDVEQEQVHLSVHDGRKLLLRYGAEDGATRFFVEGDTHILLIPDAPLFLAPASEIERDGRGGYNFDFNFATTASAQRAADALSTLLDSRPLTTESGRFAFARHWAQLGQFLELQPDHQSAEHVHHVGIISLPDLMKPELSRTTVRFDTAARRLHFASDRGAEFVLRYGHALDRDADAWPDLPSREGAQADLITRLLSRALPMLGELSPEWLE